jgi:hypothetical protein
MIQIQRARKAVCKNRVFRPGKENEVLAEPPLDPCVIPDEPPKAIRRPEPILCEARNPVRQRLLIHVPCPSLPGNGGGKQHARRQPHEIPDKAVGARRRQVLRNFDADRQIERLVQFEFLPQVVRNETRSWNLKHFQINPISIHSDGRRAMQKELSCPTSDPATHVYYAPRLYE